MGKSNLFKAMALITFSLMLSFVTQAQTITFHNSTDCDLQVEVGYQNSTSSPCTLNTIWISVPCNSTVPYTLPAGFDVFKGYRTIGDLSTPINVVYHCGTFTPNGCSGVTVLNPTGCGTCGSATQSCWRNTSGGIITGNYDVGFF